MANISKVSDGKYLVRISKGTGKARKFHNRTIRGTLAEARKYARELESHIDRGRSISAINISFKEFKEIWLRAMKPKLAIRTHSDYTEQLKRYTAHLDEKPIIGLRTHHIQQIYDEMRNRHLSATTVRNLHAVIRGLFRYAFDHEYLEKNLTKLVDLPARARNEMAVLDLSEARRFVETCQTMPNGLIFEFALETGMRPEEYLALRWRDVNFAKNTVAVTQAVVFARKGGGYSFEPCKTQKSRRLVPITPELRNRLMEHKRTQNEYIIGCKFTYAALDLVFANTIGGPFPLNNLTRRFFKPILDKSEFGKSFRLYDLRHTMATLLLIEGESPKVVADRLGHASVIQTLDTYSHVLPHIQERATQKLGSVLRFTGAGKT